MAQTAQITLIAPDGVSLKNLVTSALHSEEKMIELGLKRTRRHLRDFEQKYGMDTSEFYQKLTNDEIQETLDFIDWVGEYKTLSRLQNKLQTLREIRFAD